MTGINIHIDSINGARNRIETRLMEARRGANGNSVQCMHEANTTWKMCV